jgi:hypothetical protein
VLRTTNPTATPTRAATSAKRTNSDELRWGRRAGGGERCPDCDASDINQF